MSWNFTRMTVGSTLAVAGLLLFGVPACGPGASLEQTPPTIERLNIESTNITPGLTITMSVEVVGQGTIFYLWEATGPGDGTDAAGAFTQPETDATAWTAPLEEGIYDLRITVRDSRGIVDTSVSVLVGSGVDADADGFAVVAGDCNDADASIFPGAPEQPDGIDNDCDGQVDEGSDEVDDDADGFSDLAGDCNDADISIYPGAVETVNGVDDDCDGRIDNATDAFDDDGDGFSEEDGDCDDANQGIHPAENELLDAVDNDCDGVVDENTVGYDDDGDGYTELQGDCNDGDTDTFPGAAELPDGDDNDCNGQTDDGSFITDDDGDGWTDLAGDCDDTNPYTYPGAPEYLDNLDNDCDGNLDEGMNGTDNDGDGSSEAQGDCNDANGSIYPGAIELDDGIDNDCDGFGYSSPPVAVASVTGQRQACSPITLTAANSYDPDGDTLDFTWFFTTKPPLSDLTDDDLLNRTSMLPSFVPDAAGYWAVALQVTDGYFTSAPATVGFTVSQRPGNSPPVAQFLTTNINDSQSVTCTVDSYGQCTTCPACTPSYVINATSSTDADGDSISYDWSASKVSGDGLSPTIVDNGGGTANLSFSMSRTCGQSASGLYEVSLQIHDCNGAVDEAALQINFSCVP